MVDVRDKQELFRVVDFCNVENLSLQLIVNKNTVDRFFLTMNRDGVLAAIVDS